jgi:hypothetical protein
VWDATGPISWKVDIGVAVHSATFVMCMLFGMLSAIAT